MKNSFAFAFAIALGALPLLATENAHAGLAACGNIDLQANAMCETEVSGGCTANCTPVNFELACSAKLDASCEGSCPQVPSVSCTGSCEASCKSECEVTPAMYDCSASCKADATAQCNAQCGSSADKAHCTASCQANFAAECDASCTGKPASATCDAKCSGRCQGSCTAQSKLECQVNCQAKGYASCEETLTGGCTAECMKPEGALYCDGQYVDRGGNAQACIDAIKAALPTVKVDLSATGESSCSGSSCEANGQASASASCAYAPSPGRRGAYGAFAVLAALGAACFRRRRAV
jgi:hypothetical protein